MVTEPLNVTELDALITDTHADLTWHSPADTARCWHAINTLLDRRLTLTRQRSGHERTHSGAHQ